ncbi:exo-1,4-beta-D-glucosaminidase [Parastagonospora nodorum]|nr:exo-1,4-beta-D-glucosaminidase [Parastagonospora nodorum]KAH4155427.1 exo-1,4-beta-D-glucosaminidase [Parastagonospora nodorum]KAH5348842.1 exo-1,4-beta-D-glucosaminidase [Parastagonospora nodorum]KAH5499411.1 exo-1,4-beta-D-glucosaminidase [Parastagonospora nodorum]
MEPLRTAVGRWILALVVTVSLTLAAPFEPIDSWRVTSSADIVGDLTRLSLPGIDTSSWHHLKASKGTLMATLIANGVHTENDLFYSTNLQNIDAAQFRLPWYYRTEIKSEVAIEGNYWYTLRTNGISSRAEIYLNGNRVADKNTQAGAYGGLEYDVTDTLHVNKTNFLLIKVYPTDYNRDFALGFVDWNPYPPDNGTGIWRDVELKKSGQVGLSTPRVTTMLSGDITVYVDVKNLAKNASAIGALQCYMYDPDGQKIGEPEIAFDLKPRAQEELKVNATVPNPQSWWPKQWGNQPLYSVQCNATIQGENQTSDTTTTKFGIRTVTSTLNTIYNDTTFFINAQPFQVLGAGYTSDIFLRFDESKLRTQFEYTLAMGLNTIRLEGKQEHPRLYALADEMGLMLLSGWECCDKWEGWSYNDEGSGEKWSDADYTIANLSMRHEAGMMQAHPSILGFLVGSDFWPDDRATQIYVDALRDMNWDTPILASASQRGAPDALGNGGMKMDGPYDWVPPNYWYDGEQRLGAAGGFGSELGAGVGTPEINSLTKFLSTEDMEDLWKDPNKGLYHMSTNVSSFYTRQIYNDALWARYGEPTCLADYLIKAQMMDYEATRAQFEAYLSRWNRDSERPATGAIYWMLNNAWPSLHWNLFDYYMRPAGAYFGMKSAVGKGKHVLYDYQESAVYLVDRQLASGNTLNSTVDVEVIDLYGRILYQKSVQAKAQPNAAVKVATIGNLANATDVHLLRLQLKNGNKILDTNTYWLAPTLDEMDWDNSTWYHTPVTTYSNFTALAKMAKADLNVTFDGRKVRLVNKSDVPAVFVRMSLVNGEGQDVLPVKWSENYVTLWPGEDMEVRVEYEGHGARVEVDGRNIARRTVEMSV